MKKVIRGSDSLNLGKHLTYFEPTKSWDESILSALHTDVLQETLELFQT